MKTSLSPWVWPMRDARQKLRDLGFLIRRGRSSKLVATFELRAMCGRDQHQADVWRRGDLIPVLTHPPIVVKRPFGLDHPLGAVLNAGLNQPKDDVVNLLG
jgi:hypothetical protein